MPLAPGTRLGPYEIVAPLGAGGMGEVYRARDPRLGREVALKVLPEAFARDTERLARFEREARTVAGLNHPNIVTLYSIEEDAGVRFLTMELVEGQSLDRLVAPGGLPLARVLDLVIPLADALVAAHEKGVVHRDLKPANVMVTREGRVKVLDFGLAKPARAAVAQNAPQAASARGATQAPTLQGSLTDVGSVLGTVPYMAPEQVRGEAVDARTDLFAFGILVYELVTGRQPFAGATLADVGSAILRDAPEPLASAGTDLPRDLERIVGLCLEKAPRDRFQSALDVHNELRLLRRGLEHEKPTPARGSATEKPSIAVLPFNNMSPDPENEYFSDGLTEELLNVLAKIPDLKVTGRTSSFAFKGKQEDLRDIGHKLGVATLLEGSVRKAGNRVRITAQLIKVADGFHLWSETYDRVLDDIFAVQDDIARSVSRALHVTLLGKPATAATGNVESYELILRANHLTLQNSQPALARAVSLYREAIDKSPEDARAWAGLARAHASQAFFGHADVSDSHQRAREAAQRALALDDGLAEAHEVVGWILASLEFRWKEAGDALRKARELAPGASGPLISLANYEGFFGRLEVARQLVLRAVEVDPLNPLAHGFLARIETYAQDWEAAGEEFTKALELSPDAASLHTLLGLTYLRRGRGDEAIREIEKELVAGYRDYGLAIVYHALGRPQDSDAALARLSAAGEQWAIQLAGVHASRGEVDEAFRWLERAYEVRDSGIPLTKVHRMFENLHSDPRWPRFLERIGLTN